MSEKKNPSRKSAGPETPYEVGYGKPPRRTQFKPGQSGNPKGRPQGQRNLSTMLKEALNEKVTLREGDRTRKVPKALAIFLRILNNALQGEPKAVVAYLQFIRGERLFQEEPESKSRGLVEIDHQRIIAEYFDRQCAKGAEETDADSGGSSNQDDAQYNSNAGSDDE